MSNAAAAASASASASASAPQQQVEPAPCPICDTATADVFHRDTGKKPAKRPYLLCPQCFCIFVPPQFHIVGDVEKQRYDSHQNNAEDAGYRAFLLQTAGPVTAFLAARALRNLEASLAGATDDETTARALADLNAALKHRMQEEDDAPGKDSLPNFGCDHPSVVPAVLSTNAFARHYCTAADTRAAPETRIFSRLLIAVAEAAAAASASGSSSALVSEDDASVLLKSKAFGAAGAALVALAKSLTTSVSSSVLRPRGGGVVPFVGLDFGCGPGPTLNLMMQSTFPNLVQNPVALFDKFYFPDEAVAEHIATAGEALEFLWAHVKPGGALAVQTSRTEAHCKPKPPKPPKPPKHPEQQETTTAAAAAQDAEATTPVPAPAPHGVFATAFANWHYIKDDTHITYFHLESFRFLRRKWGASVERMFVCGPSTVMFVKAM